MDKDNIILTVTYFWCSEEKHLSIILFVKCRLVLCGETYIILTVKCNSVLRGEDRGKDELNEEEHGRAGLAGEQEC